VPSLLATRLRGAIRERAFDADEAAVRKCAVRPDAKLWRNDSPFLGQTVHLRNRPERRLRPLGARWGDCHPFASPSSHRLEQKAAAPEDSPTIGNINNSLFGKSTNRSNPSRGHEFTPESRHALAPPRRRGTGSIHRRVESGETCGANHERISR